MSYRELWRAVVLEAEYCELYTQVIYNGDPSTFLREIHYNNLALEYARHRLGQFTNKGEGSDDGSSNG